jgi:hypothetical protein
MKKILFAAFALSILFTAACCKPNDQILVRFQNTTDSALEETSMDFDETNKTFVGLIAAGETTAYIPFDYFEAGFYPGGDYDHPTGSLNGKKDGVAFSAWYGNWCGTGVAYKQLEPGKYTLQVIQVGEDSLGFYQIRFIK